MTPQLEFSRMKLQLLPHQIEALNVLSDKNRVLIAHDMGLGKTFTGAEKMHELNNPVNIVICQKSKIDDWIKHFRAYYPDMEVYNLTKKTGSIGFKNRVDAGDIGDDEMIVGVINYELIFRRSYFSHISGFTMMLDESSMIKNEATKRARFILRMHPESVIMLSGTPTAGKYEYLWSQCKLLGWNISKRAFWNSYIITKWVDYGNGYQHEEVVGYKNVDHLKKKLREHGAVFLKTNEVMTLPDQVDQNIYLEQTMEYKDFKKDRYLLMKDGTELIGDNSLTRILYERQLCGQYHKKKLEAFRDLLNSTEDRIIVFYNFTAEMELLRVICTEEGRPVSILNGKTKDLQHYEEDSNSVTLIQYQAGAMGGNFQKSNRIVYFTLPLGKGSCDLWEQSKKRIHRIGQSRTCFYYYLLVKYSIETKNLESLKLGRDLTDELFIEERGK